MKYDSHSMRWRYRLKEILQNRLLLQFLHIYFFDPTEKVKATKMQGRRGFNLFLKGLMCIATLSLFLTVCQGGTLSESESFYNFVRAVDPKNTLRIGRNGSVQNPCLNQWKGVTCDFQATISEIRFENMSLSGIIDTDSLCKLQNLRVLSLAKNLIRGSIPDSISNCRSLTHLNLSSNLLNGTVPVGINKLKNLRSLNISNNRFKRFFRMLKQDSKDVYMSEHASQAPSPAPSSPRGKSLFDELMPLMLLISGLGFFLLLTFCVQKKAAKLAEEKEILRALSQSPLKIPTPKTIEVVKPDERQSELVFFVEENERFKLEDLLDSAADLQSQSLCSTLYKVILKNNSVYAVKRLKKLQASFEEFGQTMRQIGNLKHPNILPLVGYNSTNEEKLIIYRYQRNGSLLTLLENYIAGKRDFPWKHRLSIACGIARGLDFLYGRSDDQESITPHGNIKLSNIMLNENEEPLISEYGYSRFQDPNRLGLCTSKGYEAPEKCISEKGDVFSFGVILMELLTGKSVEKTGLDLPKWVKSMVREEWTGEVFDKEVSKFGMQWAFPLLNISLKCVSHSPEERPTMAEVWDKIEEVVNAQEDISISPMSSVDCNPQDTCILHTLITDTWDTPGSNY